MRVKTIALLFCTTPALMLAGCGEKAPEAEDVAASDGAATAPDIAGAAAPGVAFKYEYAFLLPGKAISSVQREHAAACSKLGLSRCRITGMSYEQPREGEVDARLDLLLAPDAAHSFGDEAAAVVEKAEGKLDHASVNGENAGDAIKLSQQDSAAINAEVARLEERLKAKGLGDTERTELQRRIAELRDQGQTEVKSRRANEAAIASTPVSFTYATAGVLDGNGSTLGKAAGASWSSAQTAFGFATLVTGFALPWVLLIGGVVWLWRSRQLRAALRRLFGSDSTPAAD